MLGTFGGALEARQIDATEGRLTADVTGEVETEDGVLVIRRIHVAMRLMASEEVRETVERVHGLYLMRCPLYRTLHQAIKLTPLGNWCHQASFPDGVAIASVSPRTRRRLIRRLVSSLAYAPRHNEIHYVSLPSSRVSLFPWHDAPAPLKHYRLRSI
jgi:hypothetical protein